MQDDLRLELVTDVERLLEEVGRVVPSDQWDEDGLGLHGAHSCAGLGTTGASRSAAHPRPPSRLDIDYAFAFGASGSVFDGDLLRLHLSQPSATGEERRP